MNELQMTQSEKNAIMAALVYAEAQLRNKKFVTGIKTVDLITLAYCITSNGLKDLPEKFTNDLIKLYDFIENPKS